MFRILPWSCGSVMGIVISIHSTVAENTVCYSEVDGDTYSCKDSDTCCSSEAYPCCEPFFTTQEIVGIVVAGVVFLAVIALVIHVLYKKSTQNRRRTGTVADNSATYPAPTSHTYLIEAHYKPSSVSPASQLPAPRSGQPPVPPSNLPPVPPPSLMYAPQPVFPEDQGQETKPVYPRPAPYPNQRRRMSF